MTDAVPVRSRRRPFGLIVLAGIMLLKGVLIVLLLAGTALEETRIGDLLGPSGLIDEEILAVAILLLLTAVLLFVSGLGLLAYRRAGWLVAMVTTGIFIAFDIYGFLQGEANHIWMLLNIVTVFYLNQRDVRIGVGAVGAEPDAGRPA